MSNMMIKVLILSLLAAAALGAPRRPPRPDEMGPVMSWRNVAGPVLSDARNMPVEEGVERMARSLNLNQAIKIEDLREMESRHSQLKKERVPENYKYNPRSEFELDNA